MFFVFQAFIQSSVFAQGVNYEITYNDPVETRPLKVYLQYLSMEGITLGAGLGGTYSPIARIQFESQFRMTYWTPLGVDKENIVSDSKGGLNPYFEGGVNFYYTNKIKEGKGKAKLTLSGGYKYEKFIVIRCNKRRMLGLRGGVFYSQSALNIGGNKQRFKSEDGTIITPPNGKYFSVAANTFGTYFGLSTRKTKHVVADVTGYGGRRWFSDSFLFADLLLGATTLSDVNYSGQTLDTKGTEKASIGFRAGAQVNQKNVVTRIELGVRPNVVGVSSKIGMPYFLFTFAATLFGTEKFRKSDN